MAKTVIFNNTFFNQLSTEAKRNPRLRQHFNLHESYADPSQRLLNAMEPESYIQPHRHQSDPKTECFIGLRGSFALVTFDDKGTILTTVPFGPSDLTCGAELPPGTWHTVVCLENSSVFFETKPGPFNPESKKDLAPWAPEEGSAKAAAYLDTLKQAIRDAC